MFCMSFCSFKGASLFAQSGPSGDCHKSCSIADTQKKTVFCAWT